jgi:hypothetical protein
VTAAGRSRRVKRAIPLSSLLLAALCACGGASSSPAQAPAHTRSSAGDADRLSEIETLAADLRALKGTVYHARQERCVLIRPEQWAQEEDPDPLADDVCTNAERTCALAGDLERANAWAVEKCDDARRVCRTARSGCTRVTTRPHTF